MNPPDADAPPLIVVGASVRAAAASARRAGWSVHAADLYADADLRAVATRAVRVRGDAAAPWPAALEPAVAGFPVAPWFYTGALENDPDLVDRLARTRPLAGNAGAGLRMVRDPASLAAAVRAAGLAFPATLADATAAPTDGSFLVKPRAGAGGRGVAVWRGGPPPAGDRIWQRRVCGRPWSATFVMDRSGARLYATSRQLVGRTWCGARGFAWCGAVDLPGAAVAASIRRRLDRLGETLADAFGLVGLVGVDLVGAAGGDPHVIEVNPRPTASLELVERATGESMAATHLAACGRSSPRPADVPRPRDRRSWAKAVVFAERPVAMDAGLTAALETLAAGWAREDGWPPLADLPSSDAIVAAGGPALTVFAAERDPAGALAILRRRVRAVRMALRGAVSPPSGAEPRPRPPPGSTA